MALGAGVTTATIRLDVWLLCLGVQAAILQREHSSTDLLMDEQSIHIPDKVVFSTDILDLSLCRGGLELEEHDMYDCHGEY